MAQILYSSFGDALVSAKLSAEYILLGADRTILPEKHPALFYAGDVAGSGSKVIQVPIEGLLGHDPLAAGTEGSAATPTALTDSSVSVTVAYKVKAYQPGDLVRLVDATGVLDAQTFVLDAVQCGWNFLVSLVAGLSAGYATVVGTSGVNATAGDFIDAITSLNINNAPPGRLACMHPRQWGDIMTDIGTVTGGGLAYSPTVQDSILSLARGNGYQGQLAGIDVFTSTQIPLDGGSANRMGCMIARGALAWADGTPRIEDPSRQMLVGPKVKFAMDRTELAGTTDFVSSLYMGASEGVDLFGVTIQTDA